MEFLKLYDEENRNILYSMSWLNKNSNFDKSIGSFENIDLFTFLEKISSFNYQKDFIYDDVYFILEYTQDSILHLINNINKEMKREHKIVQISQAKEFDKKTILWLSRQDGRTIKEKLKNNKIKTVKRYMNIDTYENRILKIFLKKLVLIEEKRAKIRSNDDLISKIRHWLRSDDAKSINEYGNVVYNNILLHHPHYSKIFKSYKWLNRLDEKVEFYSTTYIKQLKTIIKFELLAQLQFSTNEAKILPTTLDKNSLDNFDINMNKSLLEINLERYVSKIREDENYLKGKMSFKSIKKFAKWMIENQIKIENTKDRTFDIHTKQTDQVFIDLFRLFPIVRINMQIINFPITLLQNIEGSIVNANNTKVIDLTHEIYTLPEILKTYDSDTLKFFLEYFEKYFKGQQLNYIIPDYVNIFEFSSVKKTINSYFPKSRNIPKSILAGLQYLFKGNLQKGDTLIYIQRNHDNDLYVTPLLVKDHQALQSITNGLYLEKHPTKKLEEQNDIVNELNKYFKDYKLSEKLLSKFLQNGIKSIKKEKIAFYFNKEIIYLENSKNLSKAENRITKIKSLFTNKRLFKKEYIEIHDTNEDNLYNFEKLLKYEQDGYNLWKEHLPKLAMGDMPMNGYFGDFILVDDNSEVINGTIEIKNHFIIPANTNELSFPLIFGEEKINFEAYITSNQLPFIEDIECELELKYNYEDETPYKLTFIPLDKKYKSMNVSWRGIQYKKCNELPIPSYPPKKNWEDFKKDPKRDDSGYSNLIEWTIEQLELLNDIEEIPNFIFEKEVIKIKQNKQLKGYFKWGKNDKNGHFFCFVDVNGEEIFCHSSNFKEKINIDELTEGKTIYLKVDEKDNKKSGYHITFTEVSVEQQIEKIRKEYRDKPLTEKVSLLSKSIKNIRYPLLTIWNNHSLQDFDAPNDFRILMANHISNSVTLLMRDDITRDLKEELLFFLSSIHQDMPKEISTILLNFSENLIEYKYYDIHIALALGNCKLEWQQSILKNILNQLGNISLHNKILNILAVASWRSPSFIFMLSQDSIVKIIGILYSTLSYNFKQERKDLRNIIKQLELLLAILRAREKFSVLCLDNIQTQKYIILVDNLTKHIVNEKIQLKTRLQFDLIKTKDFKDTPDLLYTLRMYLSGNIKATQSIRVLGVSDD